MSLRARLFAPPQFDCELCHMKPGLLAMNGNCGGIAPGPLPLYVGPPVDRCPVWLGQQEDAPAVESLAADLYRGHPVAGADAPTPFMRALVRLVATWKAAGEA